jgi:hypothetical protein
MVGFFGRGDRRGKGFGAEQLLGLAGSEVTERIDWVGGWSEPGAFKTATGVNTAAINSSVHCSLHLLFYWLFSYSQHLLIVLPDL